MDDVVYFTTDGDGTGYLKCGAINNTLTTVDFGAGGYTAFIKPMIYSPLLPLNQAHADVYL